MQIMMVEYKKEGRKEEEGTHDKNTHKTGKEHILLGDAELMYTTRTNWCFGNWRIVRERQ